MGGLEAATECPGPCSMRRAPLHHQCRCSCRFGVPTAVHRAAASGGCVGGLLPGASGVTSPGVMVVCRRASGAAWVGVARARKAGACPWALLTSRVGLAGGTPGKCAMTPESSLPGAGLSAATPADLPLVRALAGRRRERSPSSPGNCRPWARSFLLCSSELQFRVCKEKPGMYSGVNSANGGQRNSVRSDLGAALRWWRPT